MSRTDTAVRHLFGAGNDGLCEAESEQSRSRVTHSLRPVADRLGAGAAVAASSDGRGQHRRIQPVTFEVEVEDVTGSRPVASVEFDFEWREDADDVAVSEDDTLFRDAHAGPTWTSHPRFF